jgi:hypothetical protein
MGDRWDGDTGGISRRPRSRWDGDVSRTPPGPPGGGGRLLQQHPLLTDTISPTASPASPATSNPVFLGYEEPWRVSEERQPWEDRLQADIESGFLDPEYTDL